VRFVGDGHGELRSRGADRVEGIDCLWKTATISSRA